MFPKDFKEPPRHDSLVQLIEFCRHYDKDLYDIRIKAQMLLEQFECEGIGELLLMIFVFMRFNYFDDFKISTRYHVRPRLLKFTIM